MNGFEYRIDSFFVSLQAAQLFKKVTFYELCDENAWNEHEKSKINFRFHDLLVFF